MAALLRADISNVGRTLERPSIELGLQSSSVLVGVTSLSTMAPVIMGLFYFRRAPSISSIRFD